MSTELKLRRGTALQHQSFTGSNGEVTVDTTNKELVVHDGETVGGFNAVNKKALAATDSDVLVGGIKASFLTKNIKDTTELKALIGLKSGQFIRTMYHTTAPFGSATYIVLEPLQYRSFTGLTTADGFRDHNLIGGLIAMLVPLNGKITVQQCGAIPFTNNLQSAQNNTEAFRSACVSYESEWEALKSNLATNKRVWDTVAESGDYLLSNGFTVPKGWSIKGGSLGSTRLKILPEFASANSIPLITMGRSINSLGAPIVHSGIYVANPPPSVSDLYLNPQDIRVALDVGATPGFHIGTLWIQAAICIDFSSSGDGVVGRLFLEADSSIGLDIKNCQNIVFDEIYTFDMNNPIVFSGDTTNNISFGLIQCNYTRVAPIQLNDSANLKAISIGNLIVNQNAQFETFTACVRMRSSSVDMSIDNLECYNYNGWAVDNETGIGNVVSIGRAKLRQGRNRDVYDQGNSAKGFRANNCTITIDSLDSDVSDYAIGVVSGAFYAELTVNKGVVKGQAAGNLICELNHTNAAAGSKLKLMHIDNLTSKPLFNQSSEVTVIVGTLNNPFPVIADGGRLAIRLPIKGSTMYKVAIRANTNPSGNLQYRKVWLGYLISEISFTSNIVLNLELLPVISSDFGSAFSPEVSPQIDIDNINGGPTALNQSSAIAIISLPLSYQNIDYSLNQEFFS